MNILYVSHFSHGVNISPILNIAHLVANNGHNVHFYTVKTSYIKFKDKNIKLAEIPENVQMHYINNRFLINTLAYPFINPIKEYYDLKRIIKESHIDLVHFIFPEFLTCLPILKKSGLGVPVVLSINGVVGYDWFYGNKFVDFIAKLYFDLISRKIIKKADKVIASSLKVSSTLNTIKLSSNIEKVSSYGGYYGINTELFKPRSNDVKKRLRNKYNLPTNSFIIIYAGRFAPVKRLDYLIKLFKKLKYTNDVFLLLVGDGPQKNQLIQLAGSDSDILFIDFVDQKIISELYAASDMFILLSSGEGNAVAVMEACSSGLPLIASDVGVISDIIQNGVNGYIVNLDDDEIIEKIEDINNNHDQFSKNARKIALKEFSWGFIINNYIEMYKDMIHGE